MLGWLASKSRLGLVKLGLMALFLAALFFTLFFWRLGSLTKGLSPAELAAANSSSLQAIDKNPLYAPHKILSYGLQKIIDHGAFGIRLTSVIFGIIILVCFFLLVKSWFGKMIAFFATLFLVATPWFILLARSGLPSILLLYPIVILAAYYWLMRTRRLAAWLGLITAGTLAIYEPGGIYIVFLVLIFARKNLKQAIEPLSIWQKSLAALLGLAILGPLLYSLIRQPAVLKPLLLIPADWPSIIVGLKTTAWDILAIFWRTPVHADFIIGRLPMLNVAQTALALIGCFALFKLAKDKLYLLASLAVFGILAAGVNRDLTLLSFVLPALAVVLAAGLRYLYIEWRAVFPKNPIPKYLALVLIASLVAMHVFYGLRYALAAWPNTSDTRQVYVLK